MAETSDFLLDLASGKYKKICFLVGAGISTDAGIPDFRTRKGSMFEKYGSEVFTAEEFKKNPLNLYKALADMETTKLSSSWAHMLIKKLSDKGWIRRIYTQNIDGLEEAYHIPSDLVFQVHGAWPFGSAQKRRVLCARCKRGGDILEVEGGMPKAWLEKGTDSLPRCTRCSGIMQPDIVLYGQSIKNGYGWRKHSDSFLSDLLIVMGTSLVVYPISQLPLDFLQVVWINEDPPPTGTSAMATIIGGDYEYKWKHVVKGNIGEICQKVCKYIDL